MTSDKNEPVALKTWVAPVIETLEVRESAGFPNRGRDGGRFGADCTLS